MSCSIHCLRFNLICTAENEILRLPLVSIFCVIVAMRFSPLRPVWLDLVALNGSERKHLSSYSDSYPCHTQIKSRPPTVHSKVISWPDSDSFSASSSRNPSKEVVSIPYSDLVHAQSEPRISAVPLADMATTFPPNGLPGQRNLTSSTASNSGRRTSAIHVRACTNCVRAKAKCSPVDMTNAEGRCERYSNVQVLLRIEPT
jgi:hypothetical protein